MSISLWFLEQENWRRPSKAVAVNDSSRVRRSETLATIYVGAFILHDAYQNDNDTRK